MPRLRHLLRNRAHAVALCAGLLSGFILSAQAEAQPTIEKPTHNETIQDVRGKVSVEVDMGDTEFAADTRFRVVVDGLPIGADVSFPAFQLANIRPGRHVMQVQVIDGGGNVVGATPEIEFRMLRTAGSED